MRTAGTGALRAPVVAVFFDLWILYSIFQVLSNYYTQNLPLGCFGLNNLGFCQQPRLMIPETTLLTKNEDEWTTYLMDNGKGSPPVEYLIAFEEGLRNYADCVHSLGTRPLRSKKTWASVAKWRKREAYIALARYLLRADTGYKQWDCFRFEDYTMRMRMGLTFEVRHYPLSDGNDDEHFGKGNMKFDWTKHAYTPPKRVKSEPGEYKSPSATADTPESRHDTPMIFDVELGKLVPFE